MDEKTRVGGFEELVLLAVLRLGPEAYGLRILGAVEEVRPTSIGAIYIALERMAKKGFVSSRMGKPTAARGGRAKRYYRVEGAGIQALEQAEMARRHLRPASLSVPILGEA